VDAPPLACVLFDLYGTLLRIRLNEDSPALWEALAAEIAAAARTSALPAEVRRRYRAILAEEGRSRPDGFLMEAVFRRLLASFDAPTDVDRFGRVFRERSIEELALQPYVAPLLADLRRSPVRIGIVSNTEAVLTRFDLDRFPLLRSVDDIVLSSEVGVRKPDPRIFQIALERLRATAGSTVFVGDSLTDDVDGARRAGLMAIHLDPAAPGVDRLADAAGLVLRARPTLDAIVAALRVAGWASGQAGRNS